MKSIFRFNCVICGAHPGEILFQQFAWPPEQPRIEGLLGALRWILPRAAKSRYCRELQPDLSTALSKIADELGSPSTELYEIDGPTIRFLRSCPLCKSDPGPRPYDRYFKPWLTWHLVEGSQIDNLLFEMGVLLTQISHTRGIAARLKAALRALASHTCECGRPMAGEGLCRWCLDTKREPFTREDEEDEGETDRTRLVPDGRQDGRPSGLLSRLGVKIRIVFGAPSDADKLDDDRETPPRPRLPDLKSFLKGVDDTDLLGIGVPAWERIRTAWLADLERPLSHGCSRLQAALRATDLRTWLEPLRENLRGQGCVPSLWTAEFLDSPIPPLPAEAEAEWRPYAEWPAELLETPTYLAELPAEITPLYERAGLLTWGCRDDIEAFLSRMAIAEVRAVSNRLGAGRGRSKAEVISKILCKDPDAIRREVPEIEGRWIKTRRGLFENLPIEWLRYADSTLPLVTRFVEAKCRHRWMSETAAHSNLPIVPQREIRCPASCSGRAIEHPSRVPPWFLGCGCTLRGLGVRKQPSHVEVDAAATIVGLEDLEISRIEPFGLVGMCSRSPLGSYHLLWSESHENDNGWGWYALIHDRRVTAAGQLQRPNDGRVADDGTFAISDWLFGTSLQGAFWAFSATGQPLLYRLTDANLDKIAISSDGSFALCTLLESSGADASSLILFDLRNCTEIIRFTPGLGRADGYFIDAVRRIVIVTRDGEVSLEYDFEGNPVNPRILKEQQLRDSNGYQLRDLVARRLEGAPLSAEEGVECIELLHAALGKEISTWTQGQVWSMIARLHEDSGALSEAASAYERALELAPKLPVRRRLKQIRERL